MSLLPTKEYKPLTAVGYKMIFMRGLPKLKAGTTFDQATRYAKWACFLFLTVVSLATVSCFAKSKQQKFITIGALFPLTGASSAEGIYAVSAIQIAKKDINERGGILGKTLDVLILNDRNDADYALQQYNILKGKGIVAIIATNRAGAEDAVLSAAEKDGVLVIVPMAPAAPHAGADSGRENVFYLPYSSLDRQDQLVARFVSEYYSIFSRDPPPIAIATYASAYKLSEAIKNAGNINENEDDMTAAIRSRLQNLWNFVR